MYFVSVLECDFTSQVGVLNHLIKHTFEDVFIISIYSRVVVTMAHTYKN